MDWIREFLTNRSQQVIIDNDFSMLRQAFHRVQYLIGPLLFLLFISCKIDSAIKLYADEVLMFRSIYGSAD